MYIAASSPLVMAHLADAEMGCSKVSTFKHDV